MRTSILAAPKRPNSLLSLTTFQFSWYFHVVVFFPSLEVVRHYLYLTDENIWDSGQSTLPRAPQGIGGKSKAHSNCSPAPMPPNCGFPSTPGCLSVCLPPRAHSLRAAWRHPKWRVHGVTLFPLLQMESVGVYRFCGCTAKNKMKCDSRWEMTASGRKWADMCKYQTCLKWSPPGRYSFREGQGTCTSVHTSS